MPRAMSRATEPVGITSTGARPSWPRRMTEPLPNWRSICASAVSSAFSRSEPPEPPGVLRSEGAMRTCLRVMRMSMAGTLRTGSDSVLVVLRGPWGRPAGRVELGTRAARRPRVDPVVQVPYETRE